MRAIYAASFLFVIFPLLLNGAETDKPRLSYGYSQKSLPEAGLKDVTAAFKVWAKELGESEGFLTEAIVYENSDALLDEFKKGKIDLAALPTLDYLKVSKEINAVLALISVMQGKKTIRYMLLVQSDSSYFTLKDLKQKRLSIMKNNELGILFLNTQLLKAKLPEAEKFFSDIQKKNKESQGVLSVFFGQADACITTDINLKTMTELNPQIGKKLKIIAASSDLIEFTSFFRSDYDKAYRDKIINRTLKLRESPRGKQILTLFNSDTLEQMHEADLETTKQLLSEYNRLRGKK